MAENHWRPIVGETTKVDKKATALGARESRKGGLMRRIFMASCKLPRALRERPGSRLATLVFVAVAAISMVPDRPASAAAEDILAGAFDAVTGVPFATIALGIVKSQE
jgi:hypothetical protein